MTTVFAAFWLGVMGLTVIPVSVQAENYARVCVATSEPDTGEKSLNDEAMPGAGKKVVIHLDASVECVALVVPLVEKSWRLANNWRPQIVVLPAWDERVLPGSQVAWSWNKDADPFELWVLFFKTDAPGLDELKKLVTAMQDPQSKGQVLISQTRKLQEKLSSRMSGTPHVTRGVKAKPELVGGILRSGEFPWRDYAEKVNLNEACEGIVVIRHGH